MAIIKMWLHFIFITLMHLAKSSNWEPGYCPTNVGKISLKRHKIAYFYVRIAMPKHTILNSALKMFKKLPMVPPVGNVGMRRGLIQGNLLSVGSKQ